MKNRQGFGFGNFLINRGYHESEDISKNISDHYRNALDFNNKAMASLIAYSVISSYHPDLKTDGHKIYFRDQPSRPATPEDLLRTYLASKIAKTSPDLVLKTCSQSGETKDYTVEFKNRLFDISSYFEKSYSSLSEHLRKAIIRDETRNIKNRLKQHRLFLQELIDSLNSEESEPESRDYAKQLEKVLSNYGYCSRRSKSVPSKTKSTNTEKVESNKI